MKTNTNMSKKSARKFRAEYLAMQAEVESRRRKYQRMMEEIKEGEEQTISRMLDTAAAMCAASPTGSVTAAAIAQQFPDMSREEIVGQLVVAGGEHYNGSGRTHKATHKTTQRVIDDKGVKIDYKSITRTFVECDEYGKPIEGGQTVTLTTRQNRYKVAKRG